MALHRPIRPIEHRKSTGYYDKIRCSGQNHGDVGKDGLRVATGRAQPEPKHRFGRWRRPATGCGAGVSNDACCRTKKFRSTCRRTGQGKCRRTGQGKCRRIVPYARSASGKSMSGKNCSMEACPYLERSGFPARCGGVRGCDGSASSRTRMCSRIVAMTLGSSMQAMTRSVPPHLGQVSIGPRSDQLRIPVSIVASMSWGPAAGRALLVRDRASARFVFGVCSSGRTRPVEAGEVESGTWHQCGEAGDKIEWIEHELRRAVAKGPLEANDDLPTFVHREPFVGDGGSGDGAAELFELVTLIWPRSGIRRAGITRLRGEQKAPAFAGQRLIARQSAKQFALRTAGDQVLMLAPIALDAQEAVLQQAALQVVIEFLFDERGEQATLGVESFDKPGVVGRDG